MTKARLEELVRSSVVGGEAWATVEGLMKALWAVVEATGEAGERALEDYCAGRKGAAGES